MSCNCALFETESIIYRHILCILWRNHVTHISESYILQRWRLDACYKNVAIENDIRPFSNQGTWGMARLWTLRSKFNAILNKYVSDIHLSKLDVVLERFAVETSNECKFRTVNDQSSQSETNIGPVDQLWFCQMVKNWLYAIQLVLYQPRGGLKVHPGKSVFWRSLS